MASNRNPEQPTRVALGTPGIRPPRDLSGRPPPILRQQERYVWLEVPWAALFNGKMKHWVLWDEVEQRLLDDHEEELAIEGKLS